MNAASAVDVRTATETDAPCISAMAIHVFLDTYATEGIRADLAREALSGYSEEIFRSRIGSVYIAESNGNLLGFVETRTPDETPATEIERGMEISKLYIQPRFHGRGIGTTLLEFVENLSRHEGLPSIWLTAWSGNSHAIGFYTHRDFVDVGSVTHEIEGRIHENRLLVKHLIG